MDGNKVTRFLERNHIDSNDVIYIDHVDRKSVLHLKDTSSVSCFINVKDFLAELKDKGFVSISKGLLVSKYYIDHIDGFDYYMKDGTVLRGRNRSLAAHKKLNKLIQSQTVSVLGDKFRVLDNMPIAFCVIELLLNKDGTGVDFIFRYCNKQMEIVEGKTIEEMLNNSFYKVFPNADKKWLAAYSDVAVNGGVRYINDYSPEIDKNLFITCYQPMDGYCACILIPQEEIIKNS